MRVEAFSDRYRGVCGQCGRRRVVTDYVLGGINPGVGVTLCSECDDLASKGPENDS